MELACVAIGGACGSLLRFIVGKWLNERHARIIPIGTWFVNLSGAILLGVVVSAVHSPIWTVLLADGFLGAFTTFSTFMQETFHLLVEKERKPAWIYLIGSILTGLFGFALGHLLGGRI